MGTFLALRFWFRMKVFVRRKAAQRLINSTRCLLARKQVTAKRREMQAYAKMQGICRGWFGRVEANRRRVIREAVRFVVRTSILFGAARASAELMEPHYASQMIQTCWRRMKRRERIRQIRSRRAKMGLRNDRLGSDFRGIDVGEVKKRGRSFSILDTGDGDHELRPTPQSPRQVHKVGSWQKRPSGYGKKKKKQSKNKKKTENVHKHAYFRRGKRDSIIAFTKAAAMISKIQVLGGGEWGVRKNEDISHLVSNKITEKMKGYASAAADRVAKARHETEIRRRHSEKKELQKRQELINARLAKRKFDETANNVNFEFEPTVNEPRRAYSRVHKLTDERPTTPPPKRGRKLNGINIKKRPSSAGDKETIAALSDMSDLLADIKQYQEETRVYQDKRKTFIKNVDLEMAGAEAFEGALSKTTTKGMEMLSKLADDTINKTENVLIDLDFGGYGHGTGDKNDEENRKNDDNEEDKINHLVPSRPSSVSSKERSANPLIRSRPLVMPGGEQIDGEETLELAKKRSSVAKGRRGSVVVSLQNQRTSLNVDTKLTDFNMNMHKILDMQMAKLDSEDIEKVKRSKEQELYESEPDSPIKKANHDDSDDDYAKDDDFEEEEEEQNTNDKGKSQEDKGTHASIGSSRQRAMSHIPGRTAYHSVEHLRIHTETIDSRKPQSPKNITTPGGPNRRRAQSFNPAVLSKGRSPKSLRAPKAHRARSPSPIEPARSHSPKQRARSPVARQASNDDDDYYNDNDFEADDED